MDAVGEEPSLPAVKPLPSPLNASFNRDNLFPVAQIAFQSQRTFT